MSHQFNIFYADDDRDDLAIFESAVSEIKGNYQLHLKQNGDELMHALMNPPPQPNLIFLDLNMPDKNGYEVLSEIRATGSMSDTPVIIFSTSDDDTAIARSQELGANLYITKPGSYDSLKKAIRYTLSIDWRCYTPDSFVYHPN